MKEFYSRSPNFGCVISNLQLLCEALAESQGASFRARIGDGGRDGQKTSQTGYCDHVAMICLYYCWQKFLYKQEVGYQIDVEHPADCLLRHIGESVWAADACVIDQNGW